MQRRTAGKSVAPGRPGLASLEESCVLLATLMHAGFRGVRLLVDVLALLNRVVIPLYKRRSCGMLFGRALHVRRNHLSRDSKTFPFSVVRRVYHFRCWPKCPSSSDDHRFLATPRLVCRRTVIHLSSAPSNFQGRGYFSLVIAGIPMSFPTVKVPEPRLERPAVSAEVGLDEILEHKM
jgi:hypothetical protein